MATQPAESVEGSVVLESDGYHPAEGTAPSPRFVELVEELNQCDCQSCRSCGQRFPDQNGCGDTADLFFRDAWGPHYCEGCAKVKVPPEMEKNFLYAETGNVMDSPEVEL